MRVMYALKRKECGRYVSMGNLFTDIEHARLFKRKSDAKNCVGMKELFDIYYEIVECKIVPTIQHEHKRPSWDDYFFGLTYIVSKRSHDIHTQHGCVIVSVDNHILGTGYNGFPRGMNDSAMPTSRPEKYNFMIHAEINAVSNCIIKPNSATAYVSGSCCHNCLIHLWQNGIDTVKFINRNGWSSPDMQKQSNDTISLLLKNNSKIKFIPMEPNLDWLLTFDEKINKYKEGEKLHPINGLPL